MVKIATLTMNPTIDVAYEVERIVPTHKNRTDSEHYDPGGGGINVARVFGRLGGIAECYYLAGGPAGVLLDSLLNLRCFERHPIRISGSTRINANIIEHTTGLEYRFVPPGPTVTAEECETCLAALRQLDCEYLVLSGSLPPGTPRDFYATITRMVAEQGIRTVLDSSREPLREGLAGGGIYLVKPSQGELSALAGRELRDHADIRDAARAIIKAGQAEIVAVTMGDEGGMLVSASDSFFLPAIRVEAKSATGAGDSFLAAMLYRLASGDAPREAFRYGMAAGSAAVLSPGTDLCQPADIERLYARYLEAPGVDGV
ncbi:1-phosphofructokinase family hexose kinase [Altericroceibacterium xinjiangense]|uniref:1-phosphofructokinase family hexose kinase n=1 Tax=Altericroceibacterium xinjiangense TaxID=762261 RepID=UPI000F7E661E|nr:1-phosphofructokinase family hexose kinase [Altericroceibacterium xinjiangense]